MRNRVRIVPVLWGLCAIMPAACSTASQPATDAASPLPPVAAPASPEISPEMPPGATPSSRVPDPTSSAPPAWLGTRVLPTTDSGYGEAQPTPPELRDRRLWTTDLLPPPVDDTFVSTVAAVPAEVAARSTWTDQCPVTLDDLRYVTVAFWGFDGLTHTGELLLHHTVADDVVAVFSTLHAAKFPLEGLTIPTPQDAERPPTGDGNLSGGYHCRASRGSSRWSEHARGLAVDLNPFHNPYVRGNVVLPELASAYTDRDWVRPGMITDGDEVTKAFADIGWGWGGDWSSSKDFMHFSASGR